MVDNLVKDPMRHFIYVETGFFARWWDEQPDERRNLTRSLVKSGQLEFINGAWCMHDEASPFYTEMIDQTTRGHQFLRKNFGENAIPRGTWQIDVSAAAFFRHFPKTLMKLLVHSRSATPTRRPGCSAPRPAWNLSSGAARTTRTSTTA